METVNNDDDKFFTIDEIIKELLDIKSKFGNLYVAQIYDCEDFPVDIGPVVPCVITNSIEKSTDKFMVIFD